MQLNYNRKITDKTVSVDFDDTIAITTTRDWENAVPNNDIINKINKLYDMGWQILIVTARGQLSCDGDTSKAAKKYRKIIESWLKQHGVKYHGLRFEKYLAAYYIDDKSLNLDEFVELDIREIKTGWSGARVEKRGDRIFKTHHDSIDAADWYKKASSLINVPIVYSMIGQTLSLEYLKDNGHHFKLDDINDAIEKFSLYRSNNNFTNYIERVTSHCNHNKDFYEIIPLLSDPDIIKYFNKHSTFMHGDLSLENTIQTDSGLFFIDPIYNKDQWSSYLLDISKLLHSYRKYNRMFEYEVFLNWWIKKGLSEYFIRLLEISLWLRVLKYIPDPDLKKEYSKKTKLLIDDIILNKIQYV